MHDPRNTEPSEGASEAPRSPEKSRAEAPLPLGGGAFASPLAWPSHPERAARSHYRLTAIALVSAALLSAGIVGIALLVSSQRAATAEHARAASSGVLRAELPYEMPKHRAPSLIPKRASARLSPIPSASIARSSKATASTTATPATGSVSAQPTVQAGQVASLAREPRSGKTRVDRARRASPPAPALPEALTRAQVIAAMRKIDPAVDACFGSAHGKVNVSFSVVGKTGRAVGARVTGMTGKVGSCIARSLRRARFPKFAKPRIDISYPFAR
jgi:hypothetical protein